MTEQIDDNTFEDAIKEGKVVVDCYADWCGPCKLLGPVVEELDKEMDGIKFIKLDVDSNPNTAGKYGIMSIPTMLFFKDGKKIQQFAGYMPKDPLKDKINDIFNS